MTYGEFSLGELIAAEPGGIGVYQLRKGYEVDVTVAYVDDAGATATVEGAPVWGISDPDVVTIRPATDGMSAVLQGTGDVIGATTVLTVEADADLGAGVVPVTVSEDIQLVSGQATTASFGFGEPRPIAAGHTSMLGSLSQLMA